MTSADAAIAATLVANGMTVGDAVAETRRLTSRRARDLPIHRTEAGYPNCATCDGGGCLDCTDPA